MVGSVGRRSVPGQKLKSSGRAYVFRFAAKNGHRLAVVALMVALAVC